MSTSFFAASIGEKTIRIGDDECMAESLHRVDAAHQVSHDQPLRNASAANVRSPKAIPTPQEVNENSVFDAAKLRAAHSEDLIEFLQQWSEELDDRAARLNADIATHERRERAFRLWMQNRRQELQSQIREYRDAQSRAEAVARRLAIGG